MDINLVIASLGDVADLINSGSDTDATLKQLIIAACRHGGWLRGSIMSIDLTNGYAYVTVRHDPTLQIGRPEDQWVLATSPSLVALRGNQPIFLPDAQAAEEFPGFQLESRQRGYRSVLVMPMQSTDALGRPMVLTVNSEQVKDLGPTDFAFMNLIVHLGSIAVEKQKAISEQKQSAQQREMVLSTHTRLMEQAISDDSVQKLAELIHPILTRPALIVDMTTNTVMAGAAPPNIVMEAAQWHEIVENQLRTSILKLPFEAMQDGAATVAELHATIERQSLDFVVNIYPLRIDGEVVGALVIFVDDELTEYEKLLIGSVKQVLSVQLMRNLIRFQFEKRTMDDLFSELAEGKWQSVNDLAQRTLKFGIRLSRPHYMVVVRFSRPDGVPAATLRNIQKGIALVFDRYGATPAVASHSGHLVIIVPVRGNSADANAQDIMTKIMREIRHYISVEPTLVLSGACNEPKDYQREWRHCISVLDVAQSFNRRGILRAEEIGPLPMLLTTADAGRVTRFVNDVVGPIRRHDEESNTAFFSTLISYINSGYRNQPCADALGIHVTTLRYRLTKISELFGLDLESPDKRFDIELAIRLSRLTTN